MKFLYLDKLLIKKYAELKDNYYVYTIGDPVEIITTRSKHTNELAENLSLDTVKDKFMLKYVPNNKIYFSQSFIEDDTDENFVSCYIDENTSRVYIGKLDEFPIKSGVLTFSSTLSMNNMQQEEIQIMGNSKTVNTIKNRAKLLAVGMGTKDTLFGLYYINNSKGLAISLPNNTNKGISTQTLKLKDMNGYTSFPLEKWFEGVKIRRSV